MVDYVKVAATNTAGGPRIFNAAPPIILQPGQSTDGEVDITAAELESMKLYGEFEIVGGNVADSSKPALTGKNKDALLEIAKAEDVETAKDADGKDIPIDTATNTQIVTAIEAKRAAA